MGLVLSQRVKTGRYLLVLIGTGHWVESEMEPGKGRRCPESVASALRSIVLLFSQ